MRHFSVDACDIFSLLSIYSQKWCLISQLEQTSKFKQVLIYYIRCDSELEETEPYKFMKEDTKCLENPENGKAE